MSTSLGAQLAKLAAKNTALKGAVTADAALSKASFLFDAKQAAQIDLDTLHSLCVNGLQELQSMDSRFSKQHKGILSASWKEQPGRHMQTADDNKVLDEHLHTLLMLLSPHFLTKPAHKVLEYLVRKYRVHEFNVDSLMMCILPYHQTTHFARMLRLVKLDDTVFAFLKAHKKQGKPVHKDTLAERAARDPALLAFVGELPARCVQANTFNATALAFFTTVVLQIVRSQVNESNLKRLLPYVSHGLESRWKEYQIASLLIVTQLVSVTSLNNKLVAPLVEAAAENGQHDTVFGPMLSCLVHVCATHKQALGTLPPAAYGALKEHPLLVETLARLGERYELGAFVDLFVQRLLEDGGVQTAKLVRSFVQNVPIERHVAAITERAIAQFVKDTRRANDDDDDDDEDDDDDAANNDDEEDGEETNAVAMLVRTLEQRYPQEVDAILAKHMKEKGKSKLMVKLMGRVFGSSSRERGSGTRHQVLPDSDTTLFMAIENPDVDMRLVGLEQLSKVVDSEGVDQEFVKHSLRNRLADEELRVVAAALQFPNVHELAGRRAVVTAAARCLPHKHTWALADEDAAVVGIEALATLAEAGDASVVPSLLACSVQNNVNSETMRKKALGALGLKGSSHEQVVASWSKKLAKEGREGQEHMQAVLSACCGQMQQTLDNQHALVALGLGVLSLAHDGSAASLQTLLQALHNVLPLLVNSKKGSSSSSSSSSTASLSHMVQFGDDDWQAMDLNVFATRKGAPVDMAAVLGVCVYALEHILREGRAVDKQDDEGEALYRQVFALQKHTLGTGVAHALDKCVATLLGKRLGDRSLQFLLDEACLAKGSLYVRVRALALFNMMVEALAKELGAGAAQQVQWVMGHVLHCLVDDEKVVRHGALTTVRLLSSLVDAENGAAGGKGGKRKAKGSAAALPFERLRVRKGMQTATGGTEADTLAQLLSVLAESSHAMLEDNGFALKVVGRWSKSCTQSQWESLHAMLVGLALAETRDAELRRTLLRFALRGTNTRAHTLALCVDSLREHLAGVAQGGEGDHAWNRRAVTMMLERLVNEEGASLFAANSSVDAFALWRDVVAGVRGVWGELLLRRCTREWFAALERPSQASVVDELFAVLCDASAASPLKGQARMLLRRVRVHANLMLDVLIGAQERSVVALEILQNMDLVDEPSLLVEPLFNNLAGLMDNQRKEYLKQLLLNSLSRVLMLMKREDAAASMAASEAAAANAGDGFVDDEDDEDDKEAEEAGEESKRQRVGKRRSSKKTKSSSKKQRTKSETADNSRYQALFDVEAVVQCIRTSDNPQTHNAALLLLGSLADVLGETVLDSVLGVLTYLGSTTLQATDEYSMQAMERAIRSIAPPLVAGSVERMAALVDVFVEEFPQIAAHRRMQIFKVLVEVLTSTKMHIVFRALLHGHREVQAIHRATVQFAYKLGQEYAGLDMMLMMLQLVEDMSRALTKAVRRNDNGSSSSSSTKTTQLVQECAITLDFISGQLSSTSLLSRLQEEKQEQRIENELQAWLHLIMQQLFVIANQGSALGSGSLVNRSYEALRQVNQLFSVQGFVSAIHKVISDPAQVLRHRAIGMFNARIEQFKGQLDEAEIQECVGIIPRLVELVRAPEAEEEEVVEVLVTLEVLTRVFAADVPPVFATLIPVVVEQLGHTQGPARKEAAFLCVASLFAELQVKYCIGGLTEVMAGVVRVLGDEAESDELTVAALACLEVVMARLAAFVQPYLEPLLSHHALLHARFAEHGAEVRNKVQSVLELVVHQVEPRTLLPALFSQYVPAAKSGAQVALCTLFDLLGKVAAQLDRAGVKSYHEVIMQFLLSAFDLRKEFQKRVGSDVVDAVEERMIQAYLQLCMKLNENLFRPQFLRLCEWAQVHSMEDVNFARLVMFYKVVEALAERLKSIFVGYFHQVVEQQMTLLKMFAGAEELVYGGRSKNASKRKRQVEQQKSLWGSIVRSLLLCFRYDKESDVVNEERMEALSEALVSQLAVQPAYDVESGEYERRVDVLVECLGQLAVAAGHDELWKGLNYKVLMETRSEDWRVRLAALRVVEEWYRLLGEEFLVLLPDSIGFLAELMEDGHDEVEKKTHVVCGKIEGFLGEEIRSYM